MSIQENWDKINADITAISSRDVAVMAVTKNHSPNNIREVVSAGAVLLGENRVDVARKKFIDEGLRDEFPSVKLHMIGHLQTKKVKDAVKIFDCIQSVESVKTAREINKRCNTINKKIDILIEVNVSGELQKFGVPVDKTLVFVEEIFQLENLNLKGLMTMAPFTDNEAVVRSTFKGLRELRDILSQKFGDTFFQTLSMGMSNDYKIAVEEGSTMVRIGTALFKK